jgi:uncharacterized protein YcfL
VKPVLVLLFILIVSCTQTQEKAEKKIIETTNLIKGIENTPSEVLKEKTIIKAKDILDPSRGGFK